MTRAELLLRARQHANAEDSDRWDDALELLPLADAVMRREWGFILDAAPEYRIARRTPTSTAEGVITNADLSAAGETCYRILSVQRGGDIYGLTDLRESPYAVEHPGNLSRRYMLWNDGIKAFPTDAAQHVVYVNHYPTLPSSLAGGDTVTLPTGYDIVLELELGAEMLNKAGADDKAAAVLSGRAMRFRQEILGELQRKHGGPLLFAPDGDAFEYGG